jgi:hypothetical protein
MPTRQEVYAALESEADYQKAKWGHTASSNRPGNGERTIDEFILYISGYAHDAHQLASHTGGPEAKLDMVRKIGELCVACMVQHGAPKRS